MARRFGSPYTIVFISNPLRVSKYGKRVFVDVLEMKESHVVVHSKDQDIQDWINIALQIKECYEKYHGFVILHGTDTMAYLASALSFMFENLGKSVIFTGSQASLYSCITLSISQNDVGVKIIIINNDINNKYSNNGSN